MVLQILTHPSAWTSLRPSRFQMSVLGRTVFYNSGAALVACAIAIPAAIVIGRGRGIFSRILILLLPLGLLIPSITYGYGWVQIARLLNITIDPGTKADVCRCIWTLAGWLWPLAAISMGLALRYMDSQVQQQALLDGALLRITARQLAGPVFHPVGERDQLEGREDLALPLRRAQGQQQQRQLHVFVSRQDLEQMVELEHETDVPGAPARQLRLAHR